MIKNYLKNNLFILLFGLLFIVINAEMFTYFTNLAQDHVIENTKCFIEDSGRLYSQAININLQKLEEEQTAAAEAFSKADFSNHEKLQKLIESSQFLNSSDYVILQDSKNNNLFISDNKKLSASEKADFSGLEKLQNDFGNFLFQVDDKVEAGIKTPVFKAGALQGYLITLHESSYLSFLLPDSPSNTFYFIIDSSGQILFRSSTLSEFQNYSNFYELLTNNFTYSNHEFDISNFITENNKSGVFSAYYNNIQDICAYSELQNDLYLFIFYDHNFISSHDYVIKRSLFIFILISTLLLALSLLIVYTDIQKGKQSDKKNTGRKSEDEKQSLIFDYNLLTNTVSFTGNTEFIFGTQQKEYSVQEIRKLLKNIHYDDNTAIEQLHYYFQKKSQNFSKEFRFKCSDNQYYWYKITGTSLFDKLGNSFKFIGNLTNVNEQVHIQNEQIKIAESDVLTGLLNKDAFEIKTKTYILNSLPSDICAFFMINLDNLKQINDILGHSVGDKVIQNAGKKISLVFSERDYICRITGNTFAIFMILKRGMSEDKYVEIVKDKCVTLNTILHTSYSNELKSVKTSASIGVSFYPKDSLTEEELERQASVALNFVKSTIKNNFKLYEKSIDYKEIRN